MNEEPSSSGESAPAAATSHGAGAGHAPEPGHAHAHSPAHGHAHDEIHPAARFFLTRYIFSTDHKVIAVQFLFSGLIFFVLGGLLALAVRWQLAWPWKPMPVLSRWLWSAPSLGYQMPPEVYNKLFTMHATIMIFFVIIPMLNGAFGNFLIPLMIGARDMAFPKLNMISYWFMWPAFVLISYSFFVEGGSAEAGWTSYPSSLVDARWVDARLAQRPDLLAAGAPVRRDLVVDGVDQLHHDDRDAARPGDADVPDADDGLGDVHHGDAPGVRAAGPDLGPDHADARPRGGDQLLPAGRLRRWPTPRPSSAAAGRCCSSTCSGSTRTRRST